MALGGGDRLTMTSAGKSWDLGVLFLQRGLQPHRVMLKELSSGTRHFISYLFLTYCLERERERDIGLLFH